jgi:hypothetical protein
MISNDCLNVPNVFIIGAGRSGTTLLSNLLQNHNEIISLPEAIFIFGLNNHFGNKDIKTCTEEFISSLWLRRDYHKSTWQLDEDKLRSYIASHSGKLSFSDACRYCFFSSARALNKNHVKAVINKHPEFTFYIPLLIKLFPESKFIVLARDYRDRYLSVKENVKFSFFSSIVNGISWKIIYENIFAHQMLNSDKFIFIKYEDLIQKPEVEFKRILNFISIKVDSDPELFNKYKGEFKLKESENVLGENFNKMHKNSSLAVNANNLNKWQKKLTQDEINTLELYCGNLGLKFNYKTSVIISHYQKIKIKAKLGPKLLVNRFLFLLMRQSFSWPLKIQSFLYLYTKNRINR